jgi:hypothetical protein
MSTSLPSHIRSRLDNGDTRVECSRFPNLHACDDDGSNCHENTNEHSPARFKIIALRIFDDDG